MSRQDDPDATAQVPPPKATSGTKTTNGPDTAAICRTVLEEDPRNDPEWDEEDPKRTLGLVLDHVARQRIEQLRRDKERDALIEKLVDKTSNLADASGKRSASTTNRILLIVALLVMIVGGSAGVYSVIKYNTQTGTIEASTSGPSQPAP